MRAKAKRQRRGNRLRPSRDERRAKARHAFAAAAGFVGRLVGATLIVGGVFAGVFWVYAWATTSPRFAVTEVSISGHGNTTIEELAGLTGIERGANVFVLRTDSVERRLESHPWVRSAAVRRDPPNRVIVTVREHEPAALVVLGAMYLADARGHVFKQAGVGEGLDLPVVSGVDAGGEHDMSEEIAMALDVVGRWEQAGSPGGLELSQVHVEPLRGFTLTAVEPNDERPVVIHISSNDIGGRLERLTNLLSHLEQKQERPREIFLDNRTHPQWVVARVDE